MTHGEILPEINQKLSHIERYKPKWYKEDEQRLRGFNRDLDGQIKRLDKKTPEPRRLRFELRQPSGIEAAERGH